MRTVFGADNVLQRLVPILMCRTSVRPCQAAPEKRAERMGRAQVSRTRSAAPEAGCSSFVCSRCRRCMPWCRGIDDELHPTWCGDCLVETAEAQAIQLRTRSARFTGL
jgi:hypothetical protein